MIETINKLIRTSRYLVQEYGREPTPEEIAEKMELPLDKVRKVLKIAKEPISLETPIGEEEDSHLGDFIEDKNAIRILPGSSCGPDNFYRYRYHRFGLLPPKLLVSGILSTRGRDSGTCHLVCSGNMRSWDPEIAFA
jgi:hypothetical protein